MSYGYGDRPPNRGFSGSLDPESRMGLPRSWDRNRAAQAERRVWGAEDAGFWINIGASGDDYFIYSANVQIQADGDAFFGGNLLAASGTFATITGGWLGNDVPGSATAAIRLTGAETLPATNFLDFTATGDEEFLKHPGLTLEADGDATFSGALSAASGTFSGEVTGDTFSAVTANFNSINIASGNAIRWGGLVGDPATGTDSKGVIKATSDTFGAGHPLGPLVLAGLRMSASGTDVLDLTQYYAEFDVPVYTVGTTGLPDGDTTPSVVGIANAFTQNTSATTYTDFDDAVTGQWLALVVADSNTTFDFTGSNLIGNGGADYAANSGDMLLAQQRGGTWRCLIVKG